MTARGVRWPWRRRPRRLRFPNGIPRAATPVDVLAPTVPPAATTVLAPVGPPAAPTDE